MGETLIFKEIKRQASGLKLRGTFRRVSDSKLKGGILKTGNTKIGYQVGAAITVAPFFFSE